MNGKNQILLPLYFVIFFGFLGYSMMITIFTPLFLESRYTLLPETYSFSTRTILLGSALFLYPFGQFLSSPILGALSDHHGRKKILFYSLLATTCCYIVVATAIMTSQLTLLMVALFLMGLSEGNVTIAQSAIADVTRGDERTRYFGYIYLSASLAFIIGPLLGGQLSNPHIISWFDASVPFWFVFLLLALTTFWVLINFKETVRVKKKERPSRHFLDSLTNLKHVFSDRRFRFLYLTNFALYLAIFGFFRSYPMYLVNEFDMDVSRLAVYIAWVSVPIIFVNAGMLGFATKRMTPWQMALLSAILLGLALVILILPRSENALWLTLFLCGFFIATALPACATVLSQAAGADEQGGVLGNNQSLQFFAEAFSGLVAGVIAAIFVKLTIVVLAICAFLGAILLLFHPEKKT